MTFEAHHKQHELLTVLEALEMWLAACDCCQCAIGDRQGLPLRLGGRAVPDTRRRLTRLATVRHPPGLSRTWIFLRLHEAPELVHGELWYEHCKVNTYNQADCRTLGNQQDAAFKKQQCNRQPSRTSLAAGCAAAP